MKQARLCALTAAILFISSCSGGVSPEAEVDGFMESIGNASEVIFTADITADYGVHVFDYGVRCELGAGGGAIEILSPENIAGTRVLVGDGGATLEYEGAEVFTGEIMPEGLSPVDALPMLVELWSGGLVTEAVREGFEGEDCVAALYRVSDESDMRTWFSKKSGLPLRAEVYFDGCTVLFFNFYDFILK